MTPTPTSRDPILRMDDLHYAYPDPKGKGVGPWALAGATLSVERGEFVALMGPTGAGKSTLALAAVGIVPQTMGGRIRGVVRLNGLDARHTPVPELARQAGLVFQEPESQFLMASVREEVAFGLENLGVPRPEIRERLEWALRLVGLEGLQSRSPYHLSGGQKQRVALASVLAMRPPLLVLDEPVSSLDPAGAADLYAAIDRLRHELDLSILMITNDSEFLLERADRVLVLNQGAICLEGPTLEILHRVEDLKAFGLASPQIIRLGHRLRQSLSGEFDFSTVAAAAQQLRGLLTAPGGPAP